MEKSIEQCLCDGDRVLFIVNTTKRSEREGALSFISVWYNNGCYHQSTALFCTLFGSQLSKYDRGWDVSFDESKGTMVQRMASLAAQISLEFEYTTLEGEVRKIDAVYEGELYIPALLKTKLFQCISISFGEIM